MDTNDSREGTEFLFPKRTGKLKDRFAIDIFVECSVPSRNRRCNNYIDTTRSSD